MVTQPTVRACPYCKEDMSPDAVMCKHCGSQTATAEVSHEGTCPYCKEEIHSEAIKCKHCHSDLRGSTQEGAHPHFLAGAPRGFDEFLPPSGEIEGVQTPVALRLGWRWPWECPKGQKWGRCCIGKRCWSCCVRAFHGEFSFEDFFI